MMNFGTKVKKDDFEKKVQKSLVRKRGCFLYCLLSTAADGTTSRLALGDKVEFKDDC